MPRPIKDNKHRWVSILRNLHLNKNKWKWSLTLPKEPPYHFFNDCISLFHNVLIQEIKKNKLPHQIKLVLILIDIKTNFGIYMRNFIRIYPVLSLHPCFTKPDQLRGKIMVQRISIFSWWFSPHTDANPQGLLCIV